MKKIILVSTLLFLLSGCVTAALTKAVLESATSQEEVLTSINDVIADNIGSINLSDTESDKGYLKLEGPNSNKLKVGQYPGYIINLNGEKEYGVVKFASNRPNEQVWVNHDWIQFVSAEKFNSQFIEDDDFDYYAPFEQQEKRNFLDVVTRPHFKPINGYGVGNWHFITATLPDGGRVNDMVKTSYFITEFVSGKVPAYFVYNRPIDSSDKKGMVSSDYSPTSSSISTFLLLPDGRLRIPLAVDLEKLVADCPSVSQKLTSGTYGFQKADDKERSGLSGAFGKMFANNTIEKNNTKRVIDVIEDYNACF